MKFTIKLKKINNSLIFYLDSKITKSEKYKKGDYLKIKIGNNDFFLHELKKEIIYQKKNFDLSKSFYIVIPQEYSTRNKLKAGNVYEITIERYKG